MFTRCIAIIALSAMVIPAHAQEESTKPNIVIIWPTTWVIRTWAASAARSGRRTSTPWRPAGCGSPSSTTRRAAARRGPPAHGPLSPPGQHWRHDRRQKASRLSRPPERPLRDHRRGPDCRLPHVHGRQVAPQPEPRADRAASKVLWDDRRVQQLLEPGALMCVCPRIQRRNDKGKFFAHRRLHRPRPRFPGSGTQDA